MATQDEITEAQRAAKLALLRQIEASAAKTSTSSYLAHLAHAYALTVGAIPGKLPGASAGDSGSS